MICESRDRGVAGSGIEDREVRDRESGYGGVRGSGLTACDDSEQIAIKIECS